MERKTLSGWWRRALQAERLRVLAGAGVYARGEDYVAAGRVRRMKFDGARITAQVSGQQLFYTVRLWRRGDELQFSCDCPFAAEGAFCKHCVAVGLACAEWVDGL
jgi:uncharacterized Zn finger protein